MLEGNKKRIQSIAPDHKVRIGHFKSHIPRRLRQKTKTKSQKKHEKITSLLHFFSPVCNWYIQNEYLVFTGHDCCHFSCQPKHHCRVQIASFSAVCWTILASLSYIFRILMSQQGWESCYLKSIYKIQESNIPCYTKDEHRRDQDHNTISNSVEMLQLLNQRNDPANPNFPLWIRDNIRGWCGSVSVVEASSAPDSFSRDIWHGSK